MKTILGIIAITFILGCATKTAVRPSALPPEPTIRLRAATQTASITLAWDPAEDAAGYRLAYGTNSGVKSGVYGATNNVGNVTQTTVTNLLKNIPYYFVVKTYASNGLESASSSELVATLPIYIPATNVIALSVRVWSKTNLAGPWQLYSTLPVFVATNTSDAMYFQSDLAITLTNTAKQLLRLNNSTLVVTNR